MSAYTQSHRYQRCQKIFDRAYPGFQNAGQQYANHVGAVIDQQMHVLDVGCGRDSLASEPLQQASTCVGIDLVLDDLRANTLMTHVSMANAEHLPFATNSFDAIVSQWVVEHFSYPSNVFAELTRVLRPGGALVLMTTNAHNYVPFFSRLVPQQLQSFLIQRLLKRPAGESFPTYFRANTGHKIKRLAASNNLSVQSLDYVGNPFYLAFNVPLFRIALLFEKLTDTPRRRWLKLYIVATLQKPVR